MQDFVYKLKRIKRALKHARRASSCASLYHKIRLRLRGRTAVSCIFGKRVEILNYQHLHLQRHVEIGNNVRIQAGPVRIGCHSFIGHNSCIYGEVSLGNFVVLGPNVMLINGNHGYGRLDIPMSAQQTFSKGKMVIENDVWIGAGAIILNGVKIGRGAIIAAGAVVTKAVPEFAIVAGNPAKLIKSRCNDVGLLEAAHYGWWENSPIKAWQTIMRQEFP